jgi:hypothetical protein
VLAPRRPVAVLVGVLTLAGASACSAPASVEATPSSTAKVQPPAAEPTPTSTPTSTPTQTPTPTPTQTPTPATSPAPAAVELTAQGIGTIPFDSGVGAYDDLVAALGTPTQPLGEYCVGNAQMAEWDALTVFLHNDGTLLGWLLEAGDVPDVVRPPHGIRPGDELGRAIDRGGAPEPVVPGDPGEYATTADGILWVAAGDARETPISWIGARAPGCN